MLKVGRQPDIQSQTIVCGECAWEGSGDRLLTRLVRPNDVLAYLCVYCCPMCGSPAVGYKGKVLAFRPRPMSEPETPDTALPKQATHRRAER